MQRRVFLEYLGGLQESWHLQNKKMKLQGKMKLIVFFYAPFGKAQAKVNIVKNVAPNINVFFFPYTSATLPKTSKKQP